MSAWKTQFYNKYVKPYEKYEIIAADKIKNLYNKEINNLLDPLNGNKYDFICDDIKYEVKCDIASIKYSNFFIEYMGYSKPSGIAITQANYYIITDAENYYLIETDTLKELCNIHGTLKTTGNKSTIGYVINKNIVISNSKII